MDLLEFKYCQRIAMIKLREVVPDRALETFTSDEVETLAYIYSEIDDLAMAFKVTRNLREVQKNPI
jgi:hypothetical protein